MWEQSSPGSGLAVVDGLDVHLAEFLAKLARAGYADETQQAKRRLIVPFIHWVRDKGLAVADLEETRVSTFMASLSRRHCKHGDPEPSALLQFLEQLRVAGVAPPCRSSEPSPTEHFIRGYFDHLHSARGLCARSIEVYSPFVRDFVTAQRLPECVTSLNASTIRGYLLDGTRNRSASFVRLLTAALRSFLRFLFLDGRTEVDLSAAVPPVRRWRFAAVPPLLTPEEVEKVIAATDRSTARGRRTLAMLLLLARPGLRAGEVVALEFDDIHWKAGEIVIRGKGRVHDRLPLLDDVGEAQALYLREGRGSNASRHVFLRRRAPRVGLSGPSAVCEVARQALRRAGLRPAGRAAAHIFRHSSTITRCASAARVW